uniref:CPG4 domain-containing protein n=1 Tax=Steinernema glaseri TaxID=37863 RepID=A0A1I7YS05_9BILA
MTFNGIFYLFVFDLVVVGVSGTRFRRHQSNHQYHHDSAEQAQIEQESRATCKSVCDSEYKRDFEATFHISYSHRFYEFPLDPLITHSRRKMSQYCQVANRKFDCYQEDCAFENIPWSTDRHICIDHMGDFRQALNCLNITSPGAHRECNEACTDGWSNVLDAKAEGRYLNRSGMSSDERARYKNLNRQCHFQICQLECRKRLIESFCPMEERQHALRVIEGYYSADYVDQLSKMQKYNIVHLFPRLCSKLLPDAIKTEVDFNGHSVERTMKKFRKLAQKAVATML